MSAKLLTRNFSSNAVPLDHPVIQAVTALPQPLLAGGTTNGEHNSKDHMTRGAHNFFALVLKGAPGDVAWCASLK